MIDCGNAPPLVAMQALEQMGGVSRGLYDELMGVSPTIIPIPPWWRISRSDSTVQQHKADVGIGYDGDDDRIGAIDERGQILWGRSNDGGVCAGDP